MKLKHSIFLIIFLCSFVPVGIWIFFSVKDTENRMMSVIADNIEAIAGSQVMNIENFCEGRKESMETIAKMDMIKTAILKYETEGHSDELDAFLANNEKYKTYVASLSVVDADFNVVGSSEHYEENGLSDFQYSDTKYHAGEFIMGNAYDRETDKGMKRIIPAYLGIFHEEELIGYLIQEIDCSYFDRLRLQTDFLEDGTLYLLDGNNELITAGTALETESRGELISTIEDRENYQKAWDAFDHETYSEGIIYYEYQNQKYMTYFADISYTDWGIRVTENLSAQWKSNQSIYLLLLIEGLGIVAILFVVQMILTKKLVAPFNQIVGTLKEIQDKHDYSLRTGVSRKDEVGIVAEGIDELLDFIEKEELAEKRKHREFAQEALVRAEASNRAKSTFLYNASHDIRTPMNAIQGFTHIIEENVDNQEMVMDSVQKIKKSSDTLMKLLNNVLELSKIESGKDEQDVRPLNLKDFSDKLYVMFAKEMEEARIHFAISHDVSNNYVLADELKCTRVVMNMLGNAKKFTPTGGKVSLLIQQLSEVEEGKATYRFCVKDTGIGMSKEFQERAFEQFEMERTSTVSKVVGNGLGLSIIKKLVEQMEGECHLSSELEKGTEIWADITLSIAEDTLVESEEETVVSTDLTGKKILLVEDNEFNREIAKYILEDAGAVVEEAEDGVIAVETMKKAAPQEYQLILMDIQMPNMDGYEATKKIRSMENPEIANLPIVAMTANAFQEDREKCLQIGMNEHISKPIDVEKLLSVLSELNI